MTQDELNKTYEIVGYPTDSYTGNIDRDFKPRLSSQISFREACEIAADILKQSEQERIDALKTDPDQWQGERIEICPHCGKKIP